MAKKLKIQNFGITNSSPTFIIAELSANHGKDIEIAKNTIKAMKKSGTDAVKFQTYTADTITINSKNEYFKIKQGTIWDGKYLHDLYKDAYTPWEWQGELKDYAEKLGLIAFSSPFDKTSVDFLEEIDVPAYKIASFEITDIPLIEYVAEKGKPVIISTGVASIEDIKLAIETCRKVGNEDIALLKCTSSYPSPLNEINLKTIPDMKERFNTIVGLSDHTLGDDVAIGAVALGAKVVEKHFILDRNLGGPDSGFSMEPQEFKVMVDSIRNVEKALGEVSYSVNERNRDFSRSLFAVQDIKEGEEFTKENVRSIRPGFGLHPKYFKDILGKKAEANIERGTPIGKDHYNF
jgi:pseudaminic acid synthase